MTFPIAHTLTRKPFTGEGQSGLGNTVPTFGTPESFSAYAVAPHTVEEGSTTVTETEVADLDVFAPKQTVSLKDRFSIETNDYEVIGIQDWTMGFHGWKPGIVVELRRTA